MTLPLERSALFARGFAAAIILPVVVAGAMRWVDTASDPCDPGYDPTTGWISPLVDPTPGEPTCAGFPDKGGGYDVIGYGFDAGNALVLQGRFAVARYENYHFDFFDADDEFLDGRSVSVHDHECSAGCGITPLPGSCNPADVEPSDSPMPPACEPRDFAIAAVHEDLAPELESRYPMVNVVAVPREASKVMVTRRHYLDVAGYAGPPPVPSWCRDDLEECQPLAETEPDVRLSAFDPAFRIDRYEGDGPDDPCAGASVGSCDANVPFYWVPPPPGGFNGANAETLTLMSRLDKLGWNDVVVLNLERVPHSATQYPAAALVHDEDMRYWSVCIGEVGRLSIATVDCAYDFQAPPGEAPHRIVVGPSTRTVRDPADRVRRSFSEAVERRGDIALTWGSLWSFRDRMMVVRNSFSEPGFEGRFDFATVCDPAEPARCIPASAPPPDGIGSWAPLGRHCTVQDYLDGAGSCDAR